MFARSWPKTEFERSGDIGLPICCQERNSPSFVLHAARESETRSGEDICIYCDVILATTLRNITRVENAVPEFKTNFLARGEPVVALDLFPLGGAANPRTYQTPVVVVSANVLRVLINANAAEGGRIGVPAFNSQVQLRDSWEFCEVESSLGGVSTHIGDR